MDAREMGERIARNVVWEKAYARPMGSPRWFADLWEFAAAEFTAALLSYGDAIREEVAKMADELAASRMRSAIPDTLNQAHAEQSVLRILASAIRSLKSTPSPPAPVSETEQETEG